MTDWKEYWAARNARDKKVDPNAKQRRAAPYVENDKIELGAGTKHVTVTKRCGTNSLDIGENQ